MNKPIVTTTATGQICNESGVWKEVGNPTIAAPIAKGNRMPPYSDKVVIWRLISYA